MDFKKYLLLPPEITAFRQKQLKNFNKIALIAFVAHIPVLMAIAGLAAAAGWIVEPFDANQLIATANQLTGTYA